MAMPTFTMRQLLEAGVHFGHQTRRWNPRMAPYLFGARNGVHIIDLTQTVPMLHQALATSREVAAKGGRVLFVGTKRQAQDPVARAAQRSGQYFVNHRWLGGMLTNWRTISQSIRRLRELEAKLAEGTVGLTKRETLQLTRERDKLERALGGIKDMGGLPDLLFVVDSNKESIAVAEARVLNIPVIAVVDSNSDPKDITFPVPGNDDASRAINLYCDLMVGAVLDGIQAEMAASGADIGESEAVPEVDAPVVEEAEAPAEAPVEAPAEAEVAAEPEAAPTEAEETPAAEAAPAEEPAVEETAEAEEESSEPDETEVKASADSKDETAEVAAAEEVESEPKKAAAAG
ncbi:MAG: 30S ribosomal protein S2 [Geminicoccaceae bacterium]